MPVRPGHHRQQDARAPYGAAPYHGYAPQPGPGRHDVQPLNLGSEGGYAPQPGMAVVIATPKSAGIAVLLSFLWLGAGHLYANRIGVGVALIVYELFLAVLSATMVGLIVSVPLWLISAPIVMIMAASAAGDYNRRNGLMVR